MDCKDLMICDYVKHDGTTKIVDAVYLYSISVHDSSKPWGVASSDLVSVDDIEPIPLTEEILVKNGWRKQIMLYKNEWYGDIGLFEEHGEFYYMDFKFEYVHQLQHALRLIGIEKEIEL